MPKLDIDTWGKRKINPNRSVYNAYFPNAPGNYEVFTKNAQPTKTVDKMLAIIRKYSWQCKEIAKLLKANTHEQTLKNVFDFWHDNVQYTDDIWNGKEAEVLRSPARLWKDEEGDCDCFGIAVACTLSEQGYNPFLRMTKYVLKNGEIGNWQHIYVGVKAGGKTWILDCVLHQFNAEKPYYDKKDYFIMDGVFLNGFGSVASADVEYNNLLWVIDSAQKDPNIAAFYGYSQQHFVQMLSYLAQNWNDPATRVQAAMVLADKENQLNQLNGLAGNTFVKNVFSNIKNAVTGGDGKLDPKDLITAPVKVVGVIPRQAFRGLLKTGLFGFTKKLYFGMNPAAAQRAGVDSKEIAKLQSFYQKFLKFWTDKAQGDAKHLNDDLQEWATHKGLKGFGEPVTIATLLVSAAAIVVPLLNIAHAAGVLKVAPPTEATPEALKKWLEQPDVAQAVPELLNSATGWLKPRGETDKGTPTTNPLEEKDPPPQDKTFLEKAGDWITDNPMLVAGGAAALAGVVWYATSGSKKSGAMSGPGGKHHRRKRKTKHRTEHKQHTKKRKKTSTNQHSGKRRTLS